MTNPAAGVESHDDGSITVRLYDTEDPSNTKEDPVVERQERLDPDQRKEFGARLDAVLDLDMIVREEILVMFADREQVVTVLDQVVGDGSD